MSHYLYLSLVHFAHLPLKVALFPFVLLNHIYQCFQISLCFSFSYHSYNSYILPYRHDVHIWTTVYYCPPFQWCSPMKKKQNCQMNFFSVNLCIACSLKFFLFFYWSKTCLYRIRPCDQAILVGAMQQQRFYEGLCQVYFVLCIIHTANPFCLPLFLF